MPGMKTSLSGPAFAGRLKISYSRRSTYERRAVAPRRRMISDVRVAVPAKPAPFSFSSASVRRPAPKLVPPRQTRSRVLKRQLVSKQKPFGRRRRPVNFRSLALASLATALFVFGIGVGIVQLNTNEKVKAQVKTLAAKSGEKSDDSLAGGLPSEDRPGDISGYHVSTALPRVIKIPGIDVEAKILRLGVKASNELKSPANIYDAGWYEGSARPGESGAMFIGGHVHGPTRPGVFYDLKKMKAGDKITIERGDGKVFTYHVVKSQSYDKDSVDMGAAFSSIEPGKPGLNLMTCDGGFDDAGNYSKRLIVFAVQD
ncbi:MAG TPA: class F sortase [Candidatus Saccharimonadales bacterium]